MQQRVHGTDQAIIGGEIGGHGVVPDSWVDMGQGRKFAEGARIADEDVEFFPTLEYGGTQAVDGLVVGEVHRHQRGGGACGFYGVIKLFQAAACAGGGDDVCAFFCQMKCHGIAQSTRRAGDEGHLAFEPFRHDQPASARSDNCCLALSPLRSVKRVGYSPVKQWSVNCGCALLRPSKPMDL